MRRAPTPLWTAVGFILAASCGGAIGQSSDDHLAGEGSRPRDAGADGGQVCPRYDYGSIPPAAPTCMLEERECLTDSTVDKGCSPTRFFGSVQPFIADCHVKICADLAVAFAGGCVTEVVLPGTRLADAGILAGDLACLRATLVGTRWSCAPPDGWAQLPLTTCH